MNVTRVIHTVDSHTAGEGTRLVVGGLPPIRGETMVEKLTHAETHLGWLPGYLLLEPRGHKDLFGALLVEPCHPEADLGLIFMDNRGYEPMCGHAVIGVAVTALETGLVECSEPETWLTLDTAAGPVRVCAQVQGGGVTTVSFDNVPSFVYRQNVPLTVQGLGDLTVDVVYGGLFFFFLVLIPRLYTEFYTCNTLKDQDIHSSVPAVHTHSIPGRTLSDFFAYRHSLPSRMLFALHMLPLYLVS